jgi:hypothetical protein
MTTSRSQQALAATSWAPYVFKLGFIPTAIDTAVTVGSLSTGTFDADLASVIDSTKLHLGNAVLFTASAGTLSGRKFLIVDANGAAGYQAGADYVFDVTGSSGTLGTSDFIL